MFNTSLYNTFYNHMKELSSDYNSFLCYQNKSYNNYVCYFPATISSIKSSRFDFYGSCESSLVGGSWDDSCSTKKTTYIESSDNYNVYLYNFSVPSGFTSSNVTFINTNDDIITTTTTTTTTTQNVYDNLSYENQVLYGLGFVVALLMIEIILYILKGLFNTFRKTTR